MTLPNRIDPWGQFVATPARGSRMGNRGILHALVQGEGEAHEQPVRKRHWQHHAWVCCLTEFKDRQRDPPWSTPNNYSELFFLDEATALAAGHRPCHQCQPQAAAAFKRAWLAAHAPGGTVSAGDMNTRLHAERARRDGSKPVYEARFDALPVGALFAPSRADGPAQPGEAVWLRAPQGGLPWWFGGYGAAQAWAGDARVTVLTPPAVVAVLQHGYVPQVHDSAGFALTRNA